MSPDELKGELQVWNGLTYAVVGYFDDGLAQGYIEFKHCVRVSTLRNRLPFAEWFPKTGKAADALRTCSRGASHFTIGTLHVQGRRNDVLRKPSAGSNEAVSSRGQPPSATAQPEVHFVILI